MPDHSYLLWPSDCPHQHQQRDDNDPNVNPRIDVFLPETKPPKAMSAVIVLPGGGYGNRANHEGEEVAKFWARHGYVGIVCHYRVAPYRHPNSYVDAARAIRLVRDKSDGLNINPSRIALMGFSAGGHLASTVATQFRLIIDPHDDLTDRYHARPDRLILAYPVISMIDAPHATSRDRLIGPDADEAIKLRLSSDRHVTKDTPPTFIFHTANDPGVPVSHSLAFASACHQHKIPFDLHVFESGRHGVGLAKDEPRLSQWTDILLSWMNDWGG